MVQIVDATALISVSLSDHCAHGVYCAIACDIVIQSMQKCFRYDLIGNIGVGTRCGHQSALFQFCVFGIGQTGM